jgi:hypothetical protein
MRNQRRQTAIEALTERTGAPNAVLAIDLQQHERPLLGEIRAAELEASGLVRAVHEAHMPATDPRHGPRTVDRRRDGQALDARRQSTEIDREAGPVARRHRQRHPAAGRGRLVEEGHIALIGEPTPGIQPETGEIEDQAGRVDRHAQREALTVRHQIRDPGALSARELHQTLTPCCNARARNPPA